MYKTKKTVNMGWLFYTLLLVCCFSVRADEALISAELNEMNGMLEKVESGLSTDNRLKRIEKLVNLLLKNQELFKGETISHLEEIEGKLDRCQPADQTTIGPTTTEPPTATTTTGVETTSAPMYRDCQDAYTKGQTTSGVYTISPDGTIEVDVYCEQEVDNGGWIVFQRRFDGTLDFNKTWQTYKQGFGNLSGEHWLGNENIYKLTAKHDQKLKVVLQDGDETATADYSSFWIENEDSNFKLQIGGFSDASPPGDSFGISGTEGHQGQYFSTYDKDNDKASSHCAEYYSSGWWFSNCFKTNLNGLYKDRDDYRQTMCWRSWKGFDALSGTQMMFKAK